MSIRSELVHIQPGKRDLSMALTGSGPGRARSPNGIWRLEPLKQRATILGRCRRRRWLASNAILTRYPHSSQEGAPIKKAWLQMNEAMPIQNTKPAPPPSQIRQSLPVCPSPYALRPTPYALRPTPFALRPAPARPVPHLTLSPDFKIHPAATERSWKKVVRYIPII